MGDEAGEVRVHNAGLRNLDPMLWRMGSHGRSYTGETEAEGLVCWVSLRHLLTWQVETAEAQKDQASFPSSSMARQPEQPWAKYRTSLGLGFHICKMGVVTERRMSLVR